MSTGKQRVIRVLLVDDHEMVRMSLRLYLETCEDIDVVGQADRGQVAVELSGQLQPDLVLLDLIMPGMNGAETARAIHQHYPDVKILLLTSSVESRLIDEALQAGATGYVPKAGPDEIIEAINKLFDRA